MKKDNPWSKAKRFKFMGYEILVLKGTQEGDRRFYTELHKNGYIASMGSSMPTYTLAKLETYLRRKSLAR